MSNLNPVVKQYTVAAKANPVGDIPHHVKRGDRRITHPTHMAEVLAALKPDQAVHLSGFMTKKIAPHVPGLPKRGGEFSLGDATFLFTNVSNAKAGKRGIARERSIRRVR